MLQKRSSSTRRLASSRARRYLALALTLGVHGGLWLGVRHATTAPRIPAAGPAAVLSVALVAAAPPASAAPPAALPLPAAAPPAPGPPAPEQAAAREEIHYYLPAELDRQLIILRDRSGDADIALSSEVIMHLFVDVQGRVVAITFEGAGPGPLEGAVRAAFMTLEFLPAMKDGHAVPAQLRIAIAPRFPVAEQADAIPPA